VEIARVLIDHKAQIDCEDKDGKTPLYLCAELGRAKVIPLLIQRGANL